MTRNGAIQRVDGQALGSPDTVKARLGEAFPGIQFRLVSGSDARRFDLPTLLSRSSGNRHPYWTGGFEGRKFIVVLRFDDRPAVEKVSLTLYGRNMQDAIQRFGALTAATGWTASL